MTFSFISECKIRFSLTFEDMECLGFDISDCESSPEPEAIKGGIATLLEIAKQCAGFDTHGERIKTGIYRTDSGCDIYITRLRCMTEKSNAGDEKSGKSYGKAVMSFSDINTLISACVRLCNSRLVSSDCYFVEIHGGYKYYLIIEYYRQTGSDSDEPYALISAREYACDDADCKKKAVYDYIKEHCTLFCRKNAVNNIAKLI